jgi:hypothetical protein
MEETIDFKQHIKKKQAEKDLKIYEDIGNMLNGLPVASVMNILTTLMRGTLEIYPPKERFETATIAFNIMIANDESLKGTKQ